MGHVPFLVGRVTSETLGAGGGGGEAKINMFMDPNVSNKDLIYQTDVIKDPSLGHHAQRVEAHVQGQVAVGCIVAENVPAQQEVHVDRLREFRSFAETAEFWLVAATQLLEAEMAAVKGARHLISTSQRGRSCQSSHDFLAGCLEFPGVFFPLLSKEF